MSSIERAVERLTHRATRSLEEGRAMHGEQVIVRPKETASDKPEVELDLVALARSGYLTPDNMEGQLAEEYRVLKWPVLRNVSAKHDPQLENERLVAITSALPGEGKTFTAFNLAMSIAMEKNVTVLLVDCDLLRRSLTRLVGLDEAQGLTDLLVDTQLSVGKVIQRTTIPRLRVISAGRIRQHTTELLASDQMRDLINELSTRYSDRLVLFDTAPILMASQATVLDALVGQVLLVVQEGKTSQNAVQDAIALLDKNKAIGLVLNKSQRFFQRAYGSYYGSYYSAHHNTS